jgi:ABC-type transporter Mla MlaB component
MLDWSLEADLAEIKELDSGAVASLKDAEEIRKAAIRRHYGT